MAVSATLSQLHELSTGNPNGTRLGQSAADLIAFYGATPAAQPAATAQSSWASTTITTAPTTTITSVGSTSLTALDVTRINAAFARVEEIRVVSDALVTRVEAMRLYLDRTRTDLVALGLQKGSL